MVSSGDWSTKLKFNVETSNDPRGVQFSDRGPARTGPVLFGPVFGPSFCRIRSSVRSRVGPVGPGDRTDGPNLGNIFLFFFARMGGGMVVRDGTVCPCPEIWEGTTVPSGTARPCQILKTRPVQFGPRSTPSPNFSLWSRPVRSGPVRSWIDAQA